MVPRLITTEINPSASRGTLQGGLLDLIERMRTALPPEVLISKAEWLETRSSGPSTSSASGSAGQEGSGRNQSSATTDPSQKTAPNLAGIPREVPSLPKGHVPRKAILDGIKKALFALSSSTSSTGNGDLSCEGATLLVQGMGGSGKTVVASGIARDSEIRGRFATICFVGVGQDADIRELQRTIHLQLQRSPMDPSLREDEVFPTLQAAARGRTVLLIVDDAWRPAGNK